MNKTQMFYIFLGIILSSIIIHELVHAVQAGFQITELCGLGWSHINVGGHKFVIAGWIITDKDVSEVLAYGIQFIYSLIMVYVCFRRIGEEE